MSNITYKGCELEFAPCMTEVVNVYIEFPNGETVKLTVNEGKQELYSKLFIDALYAYNPDKFVSQQKLRV